MSVYLLVLTFNESKNFWLKWFSELIYLTLLELFLQLLIFKLAHWEYSLVDTFHFQYTPKTSLKIRYILSGSIDVIPAM